MPIILAGIYWEIRIHAHWTAGNWDRINVDGVVYTWNGAQYVCWVQYGFYGTMADGIIPAEQGFMVHVSTAPGSITIPQDARVHSGLPFYKNSVSDLLYLEINGNGYNDKALVHFDANATEAFDGEYDAYKLLGIEAAPQLYSMIPETKLTINTLPGENKNPVIPLGLKVGSDNSYTISASGIESFAAGTNTYLEDLQLQQTIKLNDNSLYSFNAGKEDAEHRFNLHFNLVGIPEPSEATKDIQIYSSNKVVYVNIPYEIKGNIFIYNLLGSQVFTVPATGISLNKIPLNTNTGYYIVKVVGDTGTRTGKVFIN